MPRPLRALPRLARQISLLPPPSTPLQCLHAATRAVATDPQCRTFRHSSPCRNEKPSFRMQLYESTAQRLAREREDESRFAEQMEARGPTTSMRLFGITILFLTGTGVSYYLGTITPKELPTTSTTPLVLAQPPKHDIRDSTLRAAWTELALIVGRDNVSTTEDDLIGHAGSEWSSYNAKAGEKPFMVVYPSSTEEISKVMKACHTRKIPVTVIAGGTSLEGHFAPTRGGICIDVARMDKILALHPEDLDVVVQPAIGWEDLNEELKEKNLFFPPDPGPGAKIGGMVGTGCSGTNAYRYGTMREWVVSLTVVLADGTVIKTRQRPRKSSAGYDLTKLFIGSEGTLGIVTEAVLKVTVLPKTTSVAVATFPNVHAAAACVGRVVGSGIQVAGIEILDDVQMRCINQSGTTSRKWKEAATLFFKFAGTAQGVKEQIGIVREMAGKSQGQRFEFARNDEEAAELWSARKEALWSMMAMRRDPGDRVWTTDVAVPMSRLADIIQQTKDDMDASGLLAGIVGHVGDGNFHSILLFNDSERAIAEGVVHRMVKRAVEMDGTVTGEHGVGLVKRDYLEHELGAGAVDAMRRIKQAFDPLCLLNCDKVVRVQPPAHGEVAAW